MPGACGPRDRAVINHQNKVVWSQRSKWTVVVPAPDESVVSKPTLNADPDRPWVAT